MDPLQQDAPKQSYTGSALLGAYRLAIQDFEGGNPAAAEAVDAFGNDLDKLALRPDEVGLQARDARKAMEGYFAARVNGQMAPLPDFSAGFDGLLNYDLDSNAHDDTRRMDLLHATKRLPAYVGPDGGAYVDAAGIPTRLPIEEFLPFKDRIVRAMRGETPGTLGPEGSNVGLPLASMSVFAKGAEYVQRAAEWAISDSEWSDIPPMFGVPTADPDFPMPALPSFTPDTGAMNDAWTLQDRQDAYATLQDPVKLRAIEEIVAQAAQEGELDIGILGSVVRTAGFLTDFWATGSVAKGLGGMAAAGAQRAVGGRMAATGATQMAQTIAAGAETTQAASSGATAAASRALFSNGVRTVRDFMVYQVASDAIYGNLKSPQDLASSGMTGAKDGAVMVGAGMAISAVRSGIMRSLAGGYDPKLGRASHRGGPIGKAIAGVYREARNLDPVTGAPTPGLDQLAASVAKLASQGRGIRETMARQGWGPHQARMIENALDSAALGIAFGAYHSAIASEGYDDLHPWQKTQRMVDGLTSPEAIGGAIAFSGHVLAQGYANKIKWGKEWEKAPPQVKAELDQLVQNVVREIAQPSSYEHIAAFREAFDSYRRASPKEWTDYQEFVSPYVGEARMAVAEGFAESEVGPRIPQGYVSTPTGWDKPPPPPPPAPPAGPELPLGPGTPPAGPAAPAAPEAGPAAPSSPAPAKSRPGPRGEGGWIDELERTPSSELMHQFGALLQGNPRRGTVEATRLEAIDRELTRRQMRARLHDVGPQVAQEVAVRKAAEPAKPAEPVEAPPEWQPVTGGGRVVGREGAVVARDLPKPLPVRYEAVEADSVIPSHDPRNQFKPNKGGDINERDYGAASGETLRRGVDEIANETRPEKLALLVADSNSPVDGPPIVTEANSVPGGNRRVMAQQVAYSRNNATAKMLREQAIAAAEHFGLDPAEVAKLKNPIIIRRVAAGREGQPGELSRALNESFTAPRVASHDAVARAKMLDPQAVERIGLTIGDETLAKALEPGSASLKSIVQELASAGALSQNEVAALSKTWRPDANLRSLIERTLVGTVVNNVKLMDDLQPETQNKLVKSAGVLMQIKRDWPEFSDLIDLAVQAVNETKSGKWKSVAEQAKQQTITERTWQDNPDAVKLGERLFKDSPNTFFDRMSELANAVRASTDPTADLFGASYGTPKESFGRAVERQREGAEAGPAPATAPRGAGAGTAEQARAGEAPGQVGGTPSLHSEPYTRGQQTAFGEVTPMTPQASKTWMAKIQEFLFPASEFRNERVQTLVRGLASTFGVTAREAEAAVQLLEASAEVWAKRTGKTIDDWYGEKLAGFTKGNLPTVEGALDPNVASTQAAVTFLADGRAVLHALHQPRISDVIHELGHVWRRSLQLEDAQRVALERWAGVKDGNWTRAAEEKFANAVVRYVRQGRAPTPGLKGAFESMGQWMKAIYRRVRGTGLDVEMSSDVRKAIESIWKMPALSEDVIVRERLAKLTPQIQAEIYNKNRNKPQYVGLSLPEIVGHELRGGLPDPVSVTPAMKLAQAGDSVLQARGLLEAHGALPMNIPHQHPEVWRAMVELARGGDAYREHFAGRKAEDALALAVEVAKRAQVQMREAMGEALPEGRLRSRAGAIFEYLDTQHSTKPVPEKLKREMIELGLMDKKGGVNRLLVSAIGRNAEVKLQRKMLEDFKELRLKGPQEAAGVYLAFNRVPNAVFESPLARAVRLDNIMDYLRKKRWISPEFNRRVLKLGAFYGQMWSGNAAGRVGNDTIKSGAMHVFGAREQFANMLRAKAEDALAKLSARFGYRAPPAADVKLLNWAIESGAFQKMKGPEDFERYRKGSGYLFELAGEINDILTQLGQASVRFGYLDAAQLEKHGGKFRPHLYLSLVKEETEAELREGKLGFAARNLSRGAGTAIDETRLQIQDPFSWLTTVTHQENKAVQFLGAIQDLDYGRYGVTEAEAAKLDPYTRGLYEYATLPLATSEASMSNGPARALGIILTNFLKEQLDPASKKPKSTQLQQTLMRYLGMDADMKPSKEGRLLLPRQLLWELEGLSRQLFNPPEVESIFEKAVYGYEQATRAFRRGLTIGRPKHWTLNIMNSISTNHLLDRLPGWDVARSMMTGKGYWADAQRDMQGMLELVKLGNPTEKPAEWTNERWDRVNALKEAYEVLNGTTFTGVGLEMSVVTDALSAAVTPDMVTSGLLRDQEALGLSPEYASQWRVAAFDSVRRMNSGLSGFDRELHKMLGSHDPAERARAIANFTSFYQLWEMSFKWAATLYAIDRSPEGLSLAEAVRYSAAGTADYANTSPLIRSFNASYGSLSNPLYRKAEGAGGAATRALLREMLKGRFWMYTSTMTGPAMAATLAHPVRAATIYGFIAAMTGALHSLSANDPEEDASYQEALRGSMANAGAELLDPATLQAMSKMNLPYPNVTGAGVPHELKAVADQAWRLMMQGKALMFQAPSRGDETRVSTTADLAPGWGNVIGAGEALMAAPRRTAAENATALLDSMSLRGAELSLSLMHTAFGGAKLLTSSGPEAWLNSLKHVRDAASDLLPTISPFFLASRDGQRMIEVTALNGQKIEEYARGIIQVDQPSPMENAGELMFSSLWRSQRLVQPYLGGVSEREAMDAIIGRLFPGATPSDGPFWDKMRGAQADVHYQLAEILSGAYDNWAKGGHTQATLDGWLSTYLFTQDGPMQTMIARQPDPERQARMVEYFQRFITSEEWTNGLDAALQLARKRAIRPDFFRQAITNALRDPTGQAMLNWLDKKVVRGTPERKDLPDYAAIFFGAVKQPGYGTTRYQQWEQVLKRMYDLGYKPTVFTDDAAEALRRQGKKPELGGLPALRAAIHTR